MRQTPHPDEFALYYDIQARGLGHFPRQSHGSLRGHSLRGCGIQVFLGVEGDSPCQRNQSEREEESEDHVRSDQNSVSRGDESAKEQLAARHARTGGRVRDHIKREENKSYSRHGQ